MKTILDYILIISLILSAIFVQIIVVHLRIKKIIKSFIDPNLFVPLYIFIQYIQITKKENGHIGIWFWLTTLSVSVTLISAIIYQFL